MERKQLRTEGIYLFYKSTVNKAGAASVANGLVVKGQEMEMKVVEAIKD